MYFKKVVRWFMKYTLLATPGWYWQKIKQMLSNTLRLNFCYLKITPILHQHHHPKIIGRILKNKQKNKCVCIHAITRLIIMKMKMKMKNRSDRYDINRPTISHINYWDQVNSWKNLWKFWNGPLCRNNHAPSPYSMLQHIGRVATP